MSRQLHEAKLRILEEKSVCGNVLRTPVWEQESEVNAVCAWESIFLAVLLVLVTIQRKLFPQMYNLLVCSFWICYSFPVAFPPKSGKFCRVHLNVGIGILIWKRFLETRIVSASGPHSRSKHGLYPFRLPWCSVWNRMECSLEAWVWKLALHGGSEPAVSTTQKGSQMRKLVVIRPSVNFHTRLVLFAHSSNDCFSGIVCGGVCWTELVGWVSQRPSLIS